MKPHSGKILKGNTVIGACLILRDTCNTFGAFVSRQGWQQRIAREADLSQTYPKTSVLASSKGPLLYGRQVKGELPAAEETCISVVFLKHYSGQSRTAELCCSTD